MPLLEQKGWTYQYIIALFYKTARSRRGHRIRICILLIFLIFIFDIISITRHHASLSTSSLSLPSSHFLDTTSNGASAVNERIYVASLHHNDEVLLRNHWIPALLSFVASLPPANVYVSILESGSYDDTKGALRELDAELEKLGIERSVVLEDRTHEDEINAGLASGAETAELEGWIQTPMGKKEMRRIPFLARERNRAMEKLGELASRAQEDGGRRLFDKVLWLNDVIFTPSQIQTLLETNGNIYAAACALDFHESYTDIPTFYDSFAVRDILGLPAATQRWPFFLSPISRSAVFEYAPVPVHSCWNGMVAFDAVPFYSVKEAEREEYIGLPEEETKKHLKFRSIPDNLAQKHLEASECCLIHADNPLSLQLGVYINPNVRVAYRIEANAIVNPDQNRIWPSAWGKFKGVWANRWARWAWNDRRQREASVIDNKVMQWINEGKQKGIGNIGRVRACLVNEMHILATNGWQRFDDALN